MIRSTFQAFETAKRALNTAQAGLDTVGHNVSNANTPGYTRQRVDQVSLSMNGVSQKYQTFGAAFTGLGSNIKAINQVRDPYLDNRYRSEASTNGELSVKNYGLTDINNIFDETTSDGLSAKLSELLDSLQKLSTKADSKEFAMVVRTTANQLAAMLNKNAQALEDARTQQKLDFTTTVASEVNTVLEKIATLNVAIKQDNFYGNPSNDLNDERNMLIDQLSEFLDIKIVRTPVEISSNHYVENVNIYLNDGSEPPIALVESGFCNQLGITEDEATGDVRVSLLDGISGFVNTNVGANGDITDNIFKGAIKGYIDIINGTGPITDDAGANTFRGIPYYQAALDEFAQKLATVFNNLNNITAGDILNNQSTLYDPTFEKNLFVPLTPKIESYSGTDNWIGAFNTGTLGFAGNTPYNISFATDGSSPPETITAEVEINGVIQTYSAKYSSTGEMHFIGDDGTVAFSITGNGTEPEDGSSIVLDASVTAKNITIAKNWVDDPLYMTATKLDPSAKASTVLSISGSTPAWLKSVENGSIPVKNGGYQFYSDPADPADPGYATGKLCVDIETFDDDGNSLGFTTYSVDKADMAAGAKLALKDSSGVVGLYITLSTSPTLSTDISKNVVNIKNETAALNDNILKFMEAMNAQNYYSTTGVTGSFHEFVVSFEDEMALDMSLNEDLLATSNTVINSYADRRDAVSAVSVDEEAINMMSYQNYYNAAARYMNVIDEALDKLINGTGVVGR